MFGFERTKVYHGHEPDRPACNDIDAILQVGTNLANAAVAAEAERWLGKPVLAMNVVTYWDALRRCGVEDRVFGYGRILEEF